MRFIGKTPPAISLGVTFALIAGGVHFSMRKTRGAIPATAKAKAKATRAATATATARAVKP